MGKGAGRGAQYWLWAGSSIHGFGGLSGMEKVNGALQRTRNQVQDDRKPGLRRASH